MNYNTVCSARKRTGSRINS